MSPSPKFGNRVAPIVFLVLLAGIGLPVAAASTPDPSIPYATRPTPAASMDFLEPVAPVPDVVRPMSDQPVPGIAYVSCTRLWTALPDGSMRRLVVSMPGISSPTFSPDGRTIAFLVDARDLWLAAADGSELRRVGPVTFSGPNAPLATGLTWSPKENVLAFALVTPEYDPWSGGSAIWRLDLETGELDHRVDGWPVPFWVRRNIGTASWQAGDGSDFEIVKNRWSSRRFSGAADDLTGAIAGLQLAALRRVPGGEIQLAYRPRSWKAKEERVLIPPDGYRLDQMSRVAFTEDSSAIVVDLRDAEGGREVGFVDPQTSEWTFLEYAWEPAASPAPMALGPPRAQEAVGAARRILWGTPGRSRAAELLLRAPLGSPFSALRGAAAVTGDPRRSGDGWLVPAWSFGRTHDGFGYLRATVRVHPLRGRLVADPVADGGVQPIASISDAVAFLDEALPAEIVGPPILPAGVVLDKGWPVYAWSYRNTSGGSLNLTAPNESGKGSRYFQIGYGETYFSMGCGGVEDPVATSVAGIPAVLGSLDGINQVLWPATLEDQEGQFSVYGEGPVEEVMAIAEALERARQA